jgi:ABC-type transporter Mla maintaining outer membrane lipid asymmetry permease subunit MlaE
VRWSAGSPGCYATGHYCIVERAAVVERWLAGAVAAVLLAQLVWALGVQGAHLDSTVAVWFLDVDQADH